MNHRSLYLLIGLACLTAAILFILALIDFELFP